jgi:hypothetical protein
MISMTINREALKSLIADGPFADQFFDTPAPYADGPNNWGVSGNTFRAFRNYDPVSSPSIRYDSWANTQAQDAVIQNFNGQNFQDLHDHLSASLVEHWSTYGEPHLNIAHKFKLVDLFILRMSWFENLAPQVRDYLRVCGNPALDGGTLKNLSCIVPGLVIGSPTMGAIKSVFAYQALQDVIHQITLQANVSKLNFDIWCWPNDRRAKFGIPNLAE